MRQHHGTAVYGADEGLIDASPMARTRPPRVPEEPVPLVPEETIKAILRACEGKALADRRDAAMIRLLLDSGARRNEIAALTVDAVDLREKIATVVGKGPPAADHHVRVPDRARDRPLSA